jgi:hypothetical protein
MTMEIVLRAIKTFLFPYPISMNWFKTLGTSKVLTPQKGF